MTEDETKLDLALRVMRGLGFKTNVERLESEIGRESFYDGETVTLRFHETRTGFRQACHELAHWLDSYRWKGRNKPNYGISQIQDPKHPDYDETREGKEVEAIILGEHLEDVLTAAAGLPVVKTAPT